MVAADADFDRGIALSVKISLIGAIEVISVKEKITESRSLLWRRLPSAPLLGSPRDRLTKANATTA